MRRSFAVALFALASCALSFGALAQEHAEPAAAELAAAEHSAEPAAAPAAAEQSTEPAAGDHAVAEPVAADAAATEAAAAEHAATEPAIGEPAAEHGAAEHGAAEHGAAEHVAPAHGAAEHGAAEHGSDEHGAAAGGHGEEHSENYIPKFINFAIFAGILVYFARRPIADFFGGRRKDIETSFAKAESAQAEAAAKVAEMEQRLSALDGQVKDILARAQVQADTERQAMLESARVEAQKILAQAEAQVADLESASVRRLKAMAADLAVEAAREIIEKQLQPEDRNRLFDRTLKGLGKAAGQ